MRKMRAGLAGVVVLAAMVAVGAVGLAFPPEKPYDPRPLMKEAEQRTTADKFTFLVFGDPKGAAAFNDVVARAESPTTNRTTTSS